MAIMRSAWMAADLARHLATIPTIVWRYQSELRQWSEWIAANHIGAIAIDCGMLRHDKHWQWALDGVRYLGTQLGGSPSMVPHLVASGPSTPERISELGETWPGPLTFASQHPWISAIRGLALLPDLETEPAARSETREQLVLDNSRVFHSVIRRSRGGSRERSTTNSA